MTAVSNIEPRQLSGIEKMQAELAKRKIHVWPALFLISLVLPFVIQIGPLRLTVYRLLLIAVLFPALIAWISGKAGPKRPTDYFMILFTLWCQLALFVDDGFSVSVEPVGMLAIETLGAYFLARSYIRNQMQFRSMIKTFQIILIIILPFAALEAITHRALLLEICQSIFKTIPVVYDGEAQYGRLGMRRAQVSFEHPILYGIFASYGFALSTIGLERKPISISTSFRGIVSVICTFFSLSSGAYLSIVMQTMLAGWEYITRSVKARWKILIGIFVSAYFVVDLISNRNPIQVFISYLVFNSDTSYYRVLIWQFGSAQALKTPWFGIGHTGDWERPWWMLSSIDNFYLVIAVTFGLPAVLFLFVALFFLIKNIGQAKLTLQEHKNMRFAWMFTLVAVLISAITVHQWNASYVMFMFFLGSGAWLIDVKDGDANLAQEGAAPSAEPPRKVGNFRPAVKVQPTAHDTKNNNKKKLTRYS